MDTYTQAQPNDLKGRHCAHSACWKPICPGNSAEKAEITWLVRAEGSILSPTSARGLGSRRWRRPLSRESWVRVRIWRSISNVSLNGRLVSAGLARIIRHDKVDKAVLRATSTSQVKKWALLSFQKYCRDLRRIHVGMGREYEYERISGLTGLNGWNRR